MRYTHINRKVQFRAPESRAQNFEGLLNQLREAAEVLRENLVLLKRSDDTESEMAANRTRATLFRLEFLGRDLGSGLVDLEFAPFDRRAWSILFKGEKEPGQVPDASVLFGVPEDDVILSHPLPPVGDPRDDLFDFAFGDLAEDDTPTAPVLRRSVEDETPTLIVEN